MVRNFLVVGKGGEAKKQKRVSSVPARAKQVHHQRGCCGQNYSCRNQYIEEQTIESEGVSLLE